MKSKVQSPRLFPHDWLSEDFIVPNLPEDETPDKAEYEGKLKKIELLEKRKDLLKKNDLEIFAFEVGRLLRDKLSLLPAKLAARVTEEPDIGKNERIIRHECNRCFREIHRRMVNFGRR